MLKFLTAIASLAVALLPAPASAAPSCEQICVQRCAPFGTGNQKRYCMRKCNESCYTKKK